MSAHRAPRTTKQPHQPNNYRFKSAPEQSDQRPLPIRRPSLRSKVAPQYGPPPIPLSQMTLENLMQILPTLDAAIIAHDWVPCVQRRHQELKILFQKLQHTPFTNISIGAMEDELKQIFHKSKDIAETYYELFDIARVLQNDDLKDKDDEIDAANTQSSEARVALARHVTKHREVCESYERDLQEIKDLASQDFRTMGIFINQYLGEAMFTAPREQVQHILEVLSVVGEPGNFAARQVSSGLYHDTQKALKKANEEKNDLKDICSEQVITINEQSRDLDQYIARMAKVIRMMQDKEHENRKLVAQNKELRSLADAQERTIKVGRQHKFDHESRQSVAIGMRSTTDDLEVEVCKRDAEITNLRNKLEKAVNRENDLQAQIRSLLQSSQFDSLHRQGRFKRLLTGGTRGSPTLPALPTTTSMLNLSQSIFTPFEKERHPINVLDSPMRSDKTSPSMTGLCGSLVMENLELPPPHVGHGRTKSFNDYSPRLRPSVQRSTDLDLNSAISTRFCHMPSNVISTASVSRSQTPNSDGKILYAEKCEFGRRRLSSDPETPILSVRFHPAHLEFDHQPSTSGQRVLSGITEVTEETGSVKRKSGSPTSEDREIYFDTLHALGRLQVHY